MSKLQPEHVLVSRNDAVGDVILAFPVCGLIKEYYPGCKVSFLGRTYTKDIALSSIFVDDFINEDDFDRLSSDEVTLQLQSRRIDTIIFLRADKRLARLAKKAGIRWRIGTLNRIFHWFTCNRLVAFSRKNSPLHEAQLNLKLLRGIGIRRHLSYEELPAYYGLKKIASLTNEMKVLLSEDKFNIVIHPKSHGNSLEWSLENFSKLISMLDAAEFRIFISGSAKEHEILKSWTSELGDRVTDISGKFTLSEFIAFINAADGLVAASTGPVHIAAACGIYTLGLYTDIKTKDAGRWGPIGPKADFLQCSNADMDTIKVEMAYNKISKWLTISHNL